MHRLILGVEKGVPLDHVNGDAFDNRRTNIRRCTPTQNNGNQKKRRDNTSGYKGVSVSKIGEITAAIQFQGKRIRLPFDSLLDAALWYDRMALAYYGEFAALNFPTPERIQNTGAASKLDTLLAVC